ncbi:hypothetical protein T492DRAFT_980373 [Pavlovales sp. CCMP2436]|nr:hypothetical protein T492DRAFT_980373 [Pavlovales sp. CCMP2436]|mmetsp:Transcript_26976/g.62148  ORF Transcript_26976/g.62148 Transcript_26976/m.62148 type:complete len:187 (-) Transcript_26976:2104-2664(-)
MSGAPHSTESTPAMSCAPHSAGRTGAGAFMRERELNRVEDEFLAELFRLTRFADADTITSAGLGRAPPGLGLLHGVAALGAPPVPHELEVARAIWTSLSPAQHRRLLAKTLACLSLPSVSYFQDAALFLLFVGPTLAPVVHTWVEQSLQDALRAAPSDLAALHRALVRVLYGIGGYSRASLAARRL